MLRALAAGTALGLGLFTVGFVAFIQGWPPADWFIERDTLHHF